MSSGFGKPRGDWRDRPCWRCGYPLRSLPGGDVRNCPECGLAIRVSLSGSTSLAMAEPGWLRRQRVACVAAAGGVALMGAAALVLLTLAGAIGLQPCVLLASVLIGLSSVGMLSAWWLLAGAERHRPRDGWRVGRLVARGLVSVMPLLLAGVVFVSSLTTPTLPGDGVGVMIVWSSFAFGIHARLARHSERLMHRAQQRRVRSYLNVVAWASWVAAVAPCATGMVFLPFVPLSHATAAGRWTAAGGTLVVVAAMVALWLATARQVRRDRAAAEAAWVSD